MIVTGTHTQGEREDDEAERLVRPAPKKKPPRHDRRREEMQTERDTDTERDPDLAGKDLSLNYKTIGGSVAERVCFRYAAGKTERIRARSRETGKVVLVSERSLREQPEKYEKLKPDDDATAGPAGQGELRKKPVQPGSDGGQEAKPKRPRRQKRPAEESLKGEGDGAATVPQPNGGEQPAPAEEVGGDTRPKPPPRKQRPSEGDQRPKPPPRKQRPEAGKPDEGSAAPAEEPLAKKLGIPAPKRREATAAEEAETSLLLADHLPPELAAQLIASGLHPDDAKELIGSYQAAKARPIGSVSSFSAKTAEFYETDPDRVKPPKSWTNADGKKVAFDALEPEEKAAAYRQHQMQVVAMSVAAEHTLQERLSFAGQVSPTVSKLMTRSLLGKLSGDQATELSKKVFETTANAKDFAKIPEGSVKAMMGMVKDDPGARSLLQSYLEANDYKRAKSLYLNKKFSERDKPAAIAEGLRAARDFFKVQARAYEGDWHEGAKRFEVKTLGQLRSLNPEKYKKVRLALDEEDAKEYRKARRHYKREYTAYEREFKKWQKDPLGSIAPSPPKEPLEPAGNRNARKPEELADEGRRLWEELQARGGSTKTAAVVASKFLISSYLSGSPMRRTTTPRTKQGLYHGVSPGEHYPRAPYPKWGPVPTRDLSESDHEAVLAAAKLWLEAPVSGDLDDGVSEQRFRHALDLALSSGTYKPDVQTYDVLLAQLRGRKDSRAKAAFSDRTRLERTIYAKFPPDSKRKAGGKLTVMLTGDVASRLKRAAYSLVALDTLSDAELETLARTMRIVTSSFDPANERTATRARDSRNSDNGARQMLRLSTEQKTSANQILASFDELAKSIQGNYHKWGMSREAAKGLVNDLDRTADAAEALFFGEASLQARQAEIAINSESFVQDALENGLLSRTHVSKAARVLQRDSDESYMDTFKNPMSPIETDSDEPYMAAYGDDQSSAVIDAEDDTGRELAPEA